MGEATRVAGKQRERFQTVADDTGRYRVELSGGEYEVNASADGYVPAKAEWLLRRVRKAVWAPGEREERPFQIVVGAGPAVKRDFALSPGAEVRGIVTDESGRPLAGATIRLALHWIDSPQGRTGWAYMLVPAERFSAVSDETGCFRIGGLLAEGAAEFETRCRGFSTAMTEVPLVSRSCEARIVLKAAPAISGIVTDESGSPVPGATILCPGAREWEDRYETADQTGRFKIVDPAQRCLWLAAWAPGHGWSGLRLNGENTADLKVVLPAASAILRGAVRDEAGRPVAGARVVVTLLRRKTGPLNGVLAFDVEERTGIAGESGGILVHLPAKTGGPLTTTDERGEFCLEGLCLGDGCAIELAVAAEGFLTKRLNLDAVRSLDLTLRAGDPYEDDEEE